MMPLSYAVPGEETVIRRIGGSPEVRKHLEDLGFTVGGSVKVVAALNGECVSLYLVFVPLSCIRLAIGYPRMMQFIRENPDAMKQACLAVAEDQKTLVRGLIEEAGVDGIFYSVQNGEENRFTAEEYKAWVSWSRYIDIMDIQEAKQRFGCTVWGGFDNRPGSFLYTASREEIEQEVSRLIAQGGKKGFILGADCSIHNELPEERIRWVVEAARKI